MTRIGVGITTYNRASNLRDTLSGVISTSSPDVIVVADDGSTDDTQDVMAEFPNVTYLRAPNGGIARNKNRLLFRLFSIERCDVVILLEDDTKPILRGWLEEWSRAALLYGHVNVRFDWMDLCHSGEGTAISPYVSGHLTGQCMAFSRKAWAKCGYMDHRFKSYGFEHIELTRRCVAAGHGGSTDRFLCMSEKWFMIDHDIPTTGNQEKIDASFEVLKLTVGETGYKPPCEDWNIFLNECLTASEKHAR